MVYYMKVLNKAVQTVEQVKCCEHFPHALYIINNNKK